MARKDDELLQTGKRKNHGGSRRETPKIIWLGLAVCIIGAALLFRSPGGDVPTGIGESRTVITVPGEDTGPAGTDSLDVAGDSLGAPPVQRSGEVDVADVGTRLTPETPETAAKKPASDADGGVKLVNLTPESPEAPTEGPAQDAGVGTTAADRPAAKTTPPAVPADEPAPIAPQEEGPYLVQVGSFGDAANADLEAARLQKMGWDARVKVANMADSSMIFRVRIGYFPDRATAEAFIKQNRKHIPAAIPVHR
ncbi:MAG: SPOR domain-containing protein [Candidatus Krumholzibacteriia bacterium]